MSNNNMTTINGGIYNMDEATVKKSPDVDLDITNKVYVDELLKTYKKSRIGLIEMMPSDAIVGEDYAIEKDIKLASEYPDAAAIVGTTYRSYGALDLSHLTSNNSDSEFVITIDLGNGIIPSTEQQAVIDNFYKAFNGEGLSFDTALLSGFTVIITGQKAAYMVENIFNGGDSSEEEMRKGTLFKFSTTLSGNAAQMINFSIYDWMRIQENAQVGNNVFSSTSGMPSEGDYIQASYTTYLPSWGTLANDDRFSFLFQLNYRGGTSNGIVINNLKIEILNTILPIGEEYLKIPQLLHPVAQVYSQNQAVKGVLYIGDKVVT